MTLACGLIGRPLSHSISAIFQQAAFDALDLDIRYHVWETPAEDLPERMRQLRQPEVLGCNVTIPHKLAVMPFLGSMDGLAQRIGAVNTIVHRGDTLEGHNTDAAGFLRSLRSDGDMDPAGASAVILGAGGAARAIAVALLDSGVSQLTIVTRRFEAAEQLTASLHDVRVQPIAASSEHRGAVLHRAHLVVNATPLGMLGEHTGESPLTPDEVIPGQLIVDLVANPLETRLMRETRAAGGRAIGGLPMLVYQGAAAFELWTGKPAPLDVMFHAARTHMRGMAG